MTGEINRHFNDRRALEERTLAEKSADRVSAIPHTALAQLHADKALAIGSPPSPDHRPVDVTALDGNVVMVNAAGLATTLTPHAAEITSDRLLARARETGRL